MSLHEAQKQLKHECEDMWQELQVCQKEINKSFKVGTTHKDHALSDIYNRKEQLLQAQLNVMKERQAPGLDYNKCAQSVLLAEELERSAEELKDTALLIADQHKEAEQEVKQLQEQVTQHRQILTVLEDKIQTVTEAVGAQSEVQVIQQLQDDYVKVNTYRQQLMKKITLFVNKHYPPPEGQRPLLGLLEELMNKCVESPHAPYVHIRDAWPPYVELLLRTGICSTHNDNDSLLRLTPFHL